MLFWNPFSTVLCSSDRRTANVASVIGPLDSIPVSAENGLHFIAESPFARLGGYWHDPPWIVRVVSRLHVVRCRIEHWRSGEIFVPAVLSAAVVESISPVQSGEDVRLSPMDYKGWRKDDCRSLRKRDSLPRRLRNISGLTALQAPHSWAASRVRTASSGSALGSSRVSTGARA